MPRIRLDTDGPVVTVRRDHPPMNAFDTAQRCELAAAVRGLADDRRVRAVVLYGLADEAVPTGEVCDTALRYARRLAEGPAAAPRLAEGPAAAPEAIKEAVDHCADTGIRSFLEHGPGKARFDGPARDNQAHGEGRTTREGWRG